MVFIFNSQTEDMIDVFDEVLKRCGLDKETTLEKAHSDILKEVVIRKMEDGSSQFIQTPGCNILRSIINEILTSESKIKELETQVGILKADNDNQNEKLRRMSEAVKGLGYLVEEILNTTPRVVNVGNNNTMDSYQIQSRLNSCKNLY